MLGSCRLESKGTKFSVSNEHMTYIKIWLTIQIRKIEWYRRHTSITVRSSWNLTSNWDTGMRSPPKTASAYHKENNLGNSCNHQQSLNCYLCSEIIKYGDLAAIVCERRTIKLHWRKIIQKLNVTCRWVLQLLLTHWHNDERFKRDAW